MVADLGLEVASAVLGPEPPKDSRPWVLGFEAELQNHDVAVAQASSRKRSAVDDEGWRLPKGNGDRRNVVAQPGLGTRRCRGGRVKLTRSRCSGCRRLLWSFLYL